VAEYAAELYRAALIALVRVERGAAERVILTVVQRSRAEASTGFGSAALAAAGLTFTVRAPGGQGLAACAAASFACFWR
jgi:hypothetical protein